MNKTMLRTGLTALAALLLTLVVASPASAGKKNFDWGFVGDEFAQPRTLTSPDAGVRAKWTRRAKKANATYVRINTYWGQTSPTPPAQPRNPNDPVYDFTAIDERVQSARARGLEVILTVLAAPRWAEAPGRPESVRPGTWKPDPVALGDFAAALAQRYKGQVRHYEAWNEPNLRNYLTPQWRGKGPVSPNTYRPMLNAFYEGVKSVDRRSKVITGGTSPVGSRPGGKIMRPLFFWRKVFCLNRKLKKKRRCNGVAKFDIFGHNAINYPKDRPTESGPHRDDVTPADFGKLRKLVRKAEKRGTAEGRRKRHPLWSTESWYESRPPERRAFSLKGQAKAMQEAMYVLWKQGASNVLWLQLRDSPYDRSTPALIGYQSGIYFVNGKRKPSARALKLPFVADRRNRKKVVLWGVAHRRGKVKITAKGEGRVAKLRARPGKVFKTKVRVRGRTKFRAKLKGRKSLKARVGKR